MARGHGRRERQVGALQDEVLGGVERYLQQLLCSQHWPRFWILQGGFYAPFFGSNLRTLSLARKILSCEGLSALPSRKAGHFPVRQHTPGTQIAPPPLLLKFHPGGRDCYAVFCRHLRAALS